MGNGTGFGKTGLYWKFHFDSRLLVFCRYILHIIHAQGQKKTVIDLGLGLALPKKIAGNLINKISGIWYFFST